MGELEKISLMSPSFFRIFLPQFHGNGTLELPKHFVKEHWKSLSKHACLEVPTGAKNKMKMKKSNGRAWLHKGWQDFVQKYSIKYGYLLLFRYQGRSSFILQIFDLTTGQIKYVSTSHLKKVDFVIKEEECDTEDREMDNQSRKFRSEKKSCSIYNKSEVLLLQKAKAVGSRNPHFSVTMKPAYVTVGSRITCYMHIPKDAATYFGKKGKDDIQLSLGGRVWSMKYYVGSSSCSPRIGSGWRKFSEENNLKEGDICTFEPVRSTDMKFEVTISRKINEQVDPVSSRGTKRKRCLSVEEKSTAIEGDETSFTVTIRKAQVGSDSRLNIPRAHTTRHLHDQHGHEIVLHRVGGQAWRLKCYVYGLDAKFIYGWKDFVIGNGLQVGDTCVFELCSRKPNHYNVTISSGAGSSSSV